MFGCLCAIIIGRPRDMGIWLLLILAHTLSARDSPREQANHTHLVAAVGQWLEEAGVARITACTRAAKQSDHAGVRRFFKLLYVSECR
jgi:hypothetical protein